MVNQREALVLKLHDAAAQLIAEPVRFQPAPEKAAWYVIFAPAVARNRLAKP